MRREVDEEFARYVRARQHQLLRAAWLACADLRPAEGLVQGALATLALRWERVEAEDPDAVVRRVLYRETVSSGRRARRDGLTTLPLGPVLPGDDWPRGERLDPSRAPEALAVLTPRQRAVVVLRHFEDRGD